MNLTTINQLIKRTGLKKGYIARKANLTQMELSHILVGRRKAKPDVKRRIIKVLKKS